MKLDASAYPSRSAISSTESRPVPISSSASDAAHLVEQPLVAACRRRQPPPQGPLADAEPLGHRRHRRSGRELLGDQDPHLAAEAGALATPPDDVAAHGLGDGEGGGVRARERPRELGDVEGQHPHVAACRSRRSTARPAPRAPRGSPPRPARPGSGVRRRAARPRRRRSAPAARRARPAGSRRCCSGRGSAGRRSSPRGPCGWPAARSRGRRRSRRGSADPPPPRPRRAGRAGCAPPAAPARR